MLASLWNHFLYYPLLNLLILLYKVFFSNLGWAIVAMTVLVRGALLPLTLSSLRAAQRQKDLKSELDRLKKKHGGDTKALAQAQMELFRKHGINPAAGCLPQIVQLLLLIALYRAFMSILGEGGKESLLSLNSVLYSPLLQFGEGETINLSFLYLDLSRPDPFVILPGLAGAAQFWASKLMLPQAKKGEKLARETSDKSDDLLYNMQEQMLYLFPMMTVLIGWKLPSGLALYWLVATLFSIATQWLIKKEQSKL